MKQARDAYLRVRDKYLQFEGVLGVGYGARERNGKLTDQMAVIVLVEKKLDPDDVVEGELLPRTTSGLAVDVREPRLTSEAHQAFLEANGLDEQDAECNMDAFFVSDAKLHRRNLRNQVEIRDNEPGDQPADPNTAVFGEIFVIEDDGTIVGEDNVVDHIAAYDLFRTEFGDHYDFVFFHYDTASGIPGQSNSSPTIHNQITGINHYKGDSYDDRAAWSSSKIQSYQKITGLTQLRRCLHETAHRWCAYAYHQEGGVTSENLHEEFASSTQKPYHWGSWFDNDDSCMDYDYDDWLDSSTVAGEFEIDDLVSGAPGTDEFGYHPLDLYLMGLIDPSDVGGFRYIDSPSDPDGDGSFSGTEVNLTVNDVIAEEGPRNPAYADSQRVFHQAFILITADMSGIGSLTDDTTVLGNLERYRRGLVEAFRVETNSRGMLDGSLLHSNYDDLYIRDNTSDSGGSTSSGAFWNSPDIWVRNSDDGGGAHQDTIRGQDNYLHAKVWNSSGSDYDDVTVRFYRANFAGTEFLYPQDWHPSQLVGEATIDVPSGGSAIAKITWESGMIPDATWHPCLLVEVIPMEVTPEQRHHVWENRKLAQKNITIVDPPGDVAGFDFPFVVGHIERKPRELTVLTVARTVDLPGLELILDPDGREVELVTDPAMLPGEKFLPRPSTRPGRPRASGGLSLELVSDAAFLIGPPGCDADRSGCVKVTLCKGSTLNIEAMGGVDGSPDRLVRLYRNGKLLYRLPRSEQLSLAFSGGGAVEMNLHADLSGVTATGQGLVQLVQSGADGTVAGGLDLAIGGN